MDRKAELERLQKDCEASFHKLGGAIEDCEYWLLQLEKADEEQQQE